jgi:hypothetical protein
LDTSMMFHRGQIVHSIPFTFIKQLGANNGIWIYFSHTIGGKT